MWKAVSCWWNMACGTDICHESCNLATLHTTLIPDSMIAAEWRRWCGHVGVSGGVYDAPTEGLVWRSRSWDYVPVFRQFIVCSTWYLNVQIRLGICTSATRGLWIVLFDKINCSSWVERIRRIFGNNICRWKISENAKENGTDDENWLTEVQADPKTNIWFDRGVCLCDLVSLFYQNVCSHRAFNLSHPVLECCGFHTLQVSMLCGIVVGSCL